MSEPDQRADDARTLALGGHCVDEAAVDLDLVDPEIAQVVEAGIACPEIVECDRDAASRSVPSTICALSMSATSALSVISISTKLRLRAMSMESLIIRQHANKGLRSCVSERALI